jgi:hypothetical protein
MGGVAVKARMATAATAGTVLWQSLGMPSVASTIATVRLGLAIW